MRYIAHKRLKGRAICGEVNLPALTVCEGDDKAIYLNGQPVCALKSEISHQHFARDDDGHGLERGDLTRRIIAALARKHRHQERWDKVWDDLVCQPYRRVDYEDYWLWNHEFYNGNINDLRHIAQLVEGVD